jgi:hypothetical protein
MSEQLQIPNDKWQELLENYKPVVEPPTFSPIELPENLEARLNFLNQSEVAQIFPAIRQILNFLNTPIIIDNLGQLLEKFHLNEIKIHQVRRLIRESKNQNSSDVKENKLRINKVGLVATSAGTIASVLELKGSNFSEIAIEFQRLSDAIVSFRSNPVYAKDHPDDDPYNGYSIEEKKDFVLKVEDHAHKLIQQLLSLL